ncbi:MAG: sulfite exporter TauE/SafE family protein [Deltaproteobacteria bacterium]
MIFLWTAFLMGLIGSLHCAGMCGPIALSLPYRVGLQAKEEAFFKILTYNLGRVLTYAMMGLVFGLIGRSFFTMGIQKWVLIILAVILIVIALFSIDIEYQSLRIPFINKYNAFIKEKLSGAIRNSGVLSFFYIGILNGFLPCGLVYMAIIAAITVGSVIQGVLYMVLFGIGTMPMMMALGFGGNLINTRFRNFLRRLYPAFMIFFAVIFLMRAFKFDFLPADFDFWLHELESSSPDNPPCCE